MTAAVWRAIYYRRCTHSLGLPLPWKSWPCGHRPFISNLHGEEGLEPKCVRPGLGPHTPPSCPSPGLHEGEPGGVAPELSRDEPLLTQPVSIPSLPKSISSLPIPNLVAYCPTEGQLDSSPPFSGSLSLATRCPCWTKFRDWQEASAWRHN